MPIRSKEISHKHKSQLGLRKELQAVMKFLDKPDTHVYYEEVNFVDKKFKTNYNLNTTLEYFENKDQILSYVDKL